MIVAVAKGYVVTRVQTESEHKKKVFIHASAHTMSHANVLASSSPSDACVHMRKEIFALHCSLLFSVPRRLHSDPEDVCSVLGTVVEC